MQRIGILGAGESGLGAALLAQQKGAEVWVSDYGTIKENYKRELVENKVPFEEGKHDLKRLKRCDLVIKSPGIPDGVPVLEALLDAGVEVISEVEFAFQYCKVPIIAITGSNGKTTTTLLTHHLLENAGRKSGIGGNVGYAFSRLVMESDFEEVVLEVSSFQLERVTHFRPDIAILLNITPDHLDRYDYKMENYAKAKFNITKNQTTDDWFIYNSANETINKYLPEMSGAGKQIEIGTLKLLDRKLKVGAYFFELPHPALQGAHNAFNAACAITAARLRGVRKEAIQEGLDSFQNAAHRMEWVGSFKKVSFINDSKATNVDATFFALKSMNMPVVWIVGGVDKGNDYSPLIKVIKEKVKAMIFLGIDNEKLKATFGPLNIPFFETKDIREAVNQAFEFASEEEVVLLSPACASFDLFNNYEDRGIQFKKAFDNLNQ